MELDPFSPSTGGESFFSSTPPFSDLLSIFTNLLHGSDPLLLVLAEQGGGKTTMLRHFLTTTRQPWKRRKIRSSLSKNQNRIFTFQLRTEGLPILLVDDGHDLQASALQRLVQFTRGFGSSPRIRQLILFAEPKILGVCGRMFRHLDAVSVQKMYIPTFSAEQTAAYLQSRLVSAGYTGRSPFSRSRVRAIHASAGGLPGLINREARHYLMQAASGSGRFRTWLGLNP